MKTHECHSPNLNKDYLLAEKLFCGECEEEMIGVSCTDKSGAMHHYYVCGNKQNGETCPKKPVRRDELENAVSVAVAENILNEEAMAQVADTLEAYRKEAEQPFDVDAYKAELEKVKLQIDNLLDALQDGLNSKKVRDSLANLEEKKRDIEARIKTAQKDPLPTVTRAEIIDYLKSFRDKNIYDKGFQRSLFVQFVTKVILYDDHFTIFYDSESHAPQDFPFSAFADDCID